MPDSKPRIRYIDFLKTLGLLLIMLAHVRNVPEPLFSIRCFDVPLMVIISGFLASASFQRRYPDGHCGARYFINRFKRLVIPTWIFLVVYFLIQYVAGFRATPEFYLASFALTRHGIGYVWVILVYLFCALLVPPVHRLTKLKCWLPIALAVYAAYEVLYGFGIGTDNVWITDTVYYIIPYGLMTVLGYQFGRMSCNLKYGIMAVSALAALGGGIYYYMQTGEVQSFQIAKYPPTLYFVAWGTFASFALMTLCDKFDLKLYQNRAVEFISKHSLWIYLWHILIITTLNHTPIKEYGLLELIILVPTSCFIVWVQDFVVRKLEARWKIGFLNYFKG